MQPIHLVQAKLQQHVEAAKSYHSSETNEWHFAIRLSHNQQVCIGKGPEESTALIEAEHRAIAYLRGAGIWKDEQQDALFCFSVALAQLKAGKRIARQGWNGKGMWLILTQGRIVENLEPNSFYEKCGFEAPVTICSHIDMKAADGSMVVGWLASQTDMLAEDWVIL